ncbi:MULTISPECIES: DUF6266 family protein [unclassified Sphingobacterium]|uniref:DUF6266 family protein n=1 Tax=unclassified Sphingobacterium TaxID=2609468 RepID=UPI00104C9080|nr:MULTISPECIES: DUF6266 family protein [unclassified Sphingobacterium]MCS3552365.1 hypothetical protein [Sphingobacterium sp. JUb21]TCR10870.1 hypothetical protein EDF66_101685 [Sphingobacterium sp. JUb20]
MARFLKGIVGAYSGKVGSVVGSSWRSVDYVKSLPKITGKKATVGQMEQRTKFALAVAFLSPIKDVLNLGYSDKLQGKATGYNKALQFLLNNGITGTYPSLEIDYSKVVISKGALSNLMGVEWAEINAGELKISWSPEINKFNAFADDSVVLLMYNKTKNFFSIMESATRLDASLSLPLPVSYTGDTLEGWIFTGHRDGVKTSLSYYLGELVLA